jgi:hypothetical protein
MTLYFDARDCHPNLRPRDLLPQPASLTAQLEGTSRPDRAARVQAYLDEVKQHWTAAQNQGLISILDRVRSAEVEMATSPVQPAQGLPNNKPRSYCEHLLIDATGTNATRLGRDLVTGAAKVADQIETGAKAAAAILQLRRLDEAVNRMLTAKRAAQVAGVTLARALTLWRVEGDMILPPSRSSIAEGIPSGRSDVTTMLNLWHPDFSNEVLFFRNNAPDANGKPPFQRTLKRGDLALELPLESLAGVKVAPDNVPSPAALQAYFRHTEIDNSAGFYPIGADTAWHGGVHLKCTQGTAVRAMSEGKIIAARLAEESIAKQAYGSNNFILTLHEMLGVEVYCLYLHLNWETLLASNAKLAGLPWVCKPGTNTPDQSLLDRFRKGAVVNLRTPISAGDPLWTSGLYGSEKARTGLIHWEVFSIDLCEGDWKQADDTDDDINLDGTLHSKLDVFAGRRQSRWDAESIAKFFHSDPQHEQLRSYACKFMSEFAVDWDLAVPQLNGRYYTRGLADRIKLYNFWSEARTAGVPLPSDAHVWHYNPMQLITESLLTQTLHRDLAQTMWFVQLAGLDQVETRAQGYPKARPIGTWSSGNWSSAGKSGSAPDAEKRWTDAASQLAIEIAFPGSGARETLVAQIADPVLFSSAAIAEGAVLLEAYRQVELLVGSLPPRHPLKSTLLEPALAYFIYNGGVESFRGAVLSALVHGYRSGNLRIKTAVKGSNIEKLISDLTSQIGSMTDADVQSKAAAEWTHLVDWMKAGPDLDTLSQFMLGAGAGAWPSFREVRGNASRYRVLLDYYQRMENGP